VRGEGYSNNIPVGLNLAWSFPTPLTACISISINWPGCSFIRTAYRMVGVGRHPTKTLICSPCGICWRCSANSKECHQIIDHTKSSDKHSAHEDVNGSRDKEAGGSGQVWEDAPSIRITNAQNQFDGCVDDIQDQNSMRKDQNIMWRKDCIPVAL
jgi:hypothetical protein